MKLILHIGQSKTGTTSLQEFLRLNRDSLKEKGILYPDYYKNNLPLGTLNHNSLAEELSGFSRYPRFSTSEYFKQIQNQAKTSNCRIIILSGESFMGAPQVWRAEPDFFTAYKKKLDTLKTFIASYSVDVVAYLRPQEEWFESAITQVIRYEGLLGKKVYESDNQLFELLKPHMDYLEILEQWKNIIAPQNMVIIPYERMHLIQQDTIQDFCVRIGLDTEGLRFDLPSSKEHKSLDLRYMQVKKELNKSPRSKTKERVIIECLDHLNNNLDKIEKYTLDTKLKSHIQLYYSDSNASLAKKYTNSISDSITFFSSNKYEIPKNNERKNSSVNVDQAMYEFKKYYHSPTMRIFYFKSFTKMMLRNKLPFVYAVLKNMHSYVRKIS